mmetsp:Transcript_45208/g.106087  ORF Transcript_45208/g.106087 Transcript_45208/m.106087 type:complete len:236 (+) Transcript_45208:359-1066(+)
MRARRVCPRPRASRPGAHEPQRRAVPRKEHLCLPSGGGGLEGGRRRCLRPLPSRVRGEQKRARAVPGLQPPLLVQLAARGRAPPAPPDHGRHQLHRVRQRPRLRARHRPRAPAHRRRQLPLLCPLLLRPLARLRAPRPLVLPARTPLPQGWPRFWCPLWADSGERGLPGGRALERGGCCRVRLLPDAGARGGVRGGAGGSQGREVPHPPHRLLCGHAALHRRAPVHAPRVVCLVT